MSGEATPGGVERARAARRGLGRADPGPQLVRFLLVGVANTTISFVAYRLLLLAATPYALAAALAFGVGAVNGYILNRRWTFAARDSGRARLLYVAVQVAGALATSALTVLFVAAGVAEGWAYLLAIPPVTLAMIAANRAWTFADRD